MSLQKSSIHQKKRFVSIFHNRKSAWIILAISVALTIAAYFYSDSSVKQRTQDRFEFRALEIERAIHDRMTVYEQVLWSGVAYMYSTQKVDRKSFAKYVESLNIEKYWPGIQGVGFSVPVKPSEKEQHIAEVQAEGFPEYHIKPEGERAMYSAIVFLEPFDWRNKRAFGYDMWSNDMRRAAMNRALETGAAATSGIITLVQETSDDVQKGFLTYVPVYKSKKIPQTLEDRQEQFQGWVYAPFRAGNLMKGILGIEDPNIDFEIYDGDAMSKDSLLFDSNDELHLDSGNQLRLQKTAQIQLQGRTWTLFFSKPQSGLTDSEQRQPQLIAFAGIIIDILLFYVIYSLSFINKRAENMAKTMTVELENSKNSLEEQVRERTFELQKARDDLDEKIKKRTADLEEKIIQLESFNEATIGREKRIIELKKQINELHSEKNEDPPFNVG